MKVKSLLKVIGDGTYVAIEDSTGKLHTFDTAGYILKLGVSAMLSRNVHVILPEPYASLNGRYGITIVVEDENADN